MIFLKKCIYVIFNNKQLLSFAFNIFILLLFATFFFSIPFGFLFCLFDTFLL